MAANKKTYRVAEPGGASRIREQLRLWSTEAPLLSRRPRFREGAYEERLGALLREDLSFDSENTSHPRHNVHAFAAKFPPQLPAFFIEQLTDEGEVVLDPMMGSGTAVLEAALLRRLGLGFDIDPLAYRVSLIKVMRLRAEAVSKAAFNVVKEAQRDLKDPELLRRSIEAAFTAETRGFIDYWFVPSTQCELMALTGAISRVEDPAVRSFLEVALSGSIVTKSGGVSMARDLAHSRPHRVAAKVPKNAVEQFRQRVRKNLKSQTGPVPQGAAKVFRGDARQLPIEDNSVDLIVTSPPYANAIDYMRAHKFSLVWLGQPIESLSELRSTYIGTERTGSEGVTTYGRISAAVLSALSKRDEKKRRVMSRYLRDMSQVFSEMLRVLVPGRCAVVVVGSSMMRGFDVRTQDCLAEVARSIGWRVVGMGLRSIARDKRMMPMRRESCPATGIERRISSEFVIGMVKPQ